MSNPLVSICIPNYNYGVYIENSIKSACDQTYSNIEVIVIDNASTDNSVDIVNNLKKEYNVKLVVNDENIGMVKNFKKCLEVCKGEYVLFLSSDDVIMPTFIKRCIDVFMNFNVGMVGTNFDFINEKNEKTKNKPFYKNSCIIRSKEQARIFLMGNCFAPSQVLIRKKCLMEIGGFDSKYTHAFDWNVWFKISLKNDIGYINESLSLYRDHINNTIVSIKNMNVIFELYTLKLDFIKLIKNNEYLEQYKEELITKLSRNALKYCIQMINEKEYDISKKYLEISKVFNLNVVNETIFKILQFCLYSDYKEPIKLYDKLKDDFEECINGKPYDIPKGSIIF